MTEAVTKGTYSDLKFVKSRKVAQITVEIPIEQADDFISAFGTPRPDKETWVALARLDGSATETKPEPRKTSLAQKAGILCNDTMFQAYLRETYTAAWDELHQGLHAPDVAAELVRSITTVQSRAEFDVNHAAAQRFNAMLGKYEAWKRCAA